MEDPIAPPPPPPPPEGTPPPTLPQERGSALDDAQPPQEPPPAAHGTYDETAPLPPAEPLHDGPPADAEELAQADLAAAATAASAAGVEATDDSLPTIPDISAIPEAVKSVCLADGIPEAEFARDFPLPVEVRERLLVKVAEKLTGHAYPVTDAVRNAAANITTVGKLIEYFEEGHPDHPTATGQSER